MSSEHYIGVMSGTSVDGVDAVLANFGASPLCSVAAAHVAFPASLRAELNALQRSGADEIHRAALAANALMDCCAAAAGDVLTQAGLEARAIAAIARGSSPACVNTSPVAAAQQSINALAASAARWISSAPDRCSAFSSARSDAGNVTCAAAMERNGEALKSASTASTPSTLVPDITPI